MSTRPDDQGDRRFTLRAYRKTQLITIEYDDPRRFIVLSEDEARRLAEALLAAVRELKGQTS
jgi:hypothetical protein